MFTGRKHAQRIFFFGAVLLGSVLATVPERGSAQEYSRSRKRDIYFTLQTIGGKQLDFETSSGIVPLKMDTVYLGGIGFGYHFNGSLGLRFETLFGETTFHGKGPAAGTSRRVMMDSAMANLDWYLNYRPVTPYLTGGIGIQYIQGEMTNNSTSVAYYDPWWGYTVTSNFPGYTETDFVSSLGAGVRWDINERIFLRASVDSSWINYVNVPGTTNQIKYGLTVGAAY